MDILQAVLLYALIIAGGAFVLLVIIPSLLFIYAKAIRYGSIKADKLEEESNNRETKNGKP